MAQLSQEILKVPATPGSVKPNILIVLKRFLITNSSMTTGLDFFAAQLDPA